MFYKVIKKYNLYEKHVNYGHEEFLNSWHALKHQVKEIIEIHIKLNIKPFSTKQNMLQVFISKRILYRNNYILSQIT